MVHLHPSDIVWSGIEVSFLGAVSGYGSNLVT